MNTKELTKAAKAAMKQVQEDSDEEIYFYNDGTFTLLDLEEICAALRCLET